MRSILIVASVYLLAGAVLTLYLAVSSGPVWTRTQQQGVVFNYGGGMSVVGTRFHIVAYDRPAWAWYLPAGLGIAGCACAVWALRKQNKAGLEERVEK